MARGAHVNGIHQGFTTEGTPARIKSDARVPPSSLLTRTSCACPCHLSASPHAVVQKTENSLPRNCDTASQARGRVVIGPVNRLRQVVDDNVEDPADGFRGAPQKLVSAREGGNVFRAHGHFVNPADGNGQGSVDCRRCQVFEGRVLVIRNHPGPVVSHLDEVDDHIEGNVSLEPDREPLTVASHGSNAYT
jgi:hypothetical protein